MAKLTLTDLSGGYLAPAAINANNTLLETALENTLSRDGTSPNTMLANLDLNSYKVINHATPTATTDVANKAYVDAVAASFNDGTTLASLLSASSGSTLLGFLQAGTGAGPRTMQAKNREIVSVTDFYADGVGTSTVMVDPTGVVDSTGGLNAAFAISNAIVLVPRGTYLYTANLTTPVCAEIRGEGESASILKPSAAVTIGLILTGLTRVSGFQVDGVNTSAATGIKFGNGGTAWSGQLSDVRVRRFTGTGAYGMWIYEVLKSTFIKPYIDACDTNLLINGAGTAGYPTSTEIFGITSTDAVQYGIKGVHGETIHFFGGAVDSSGKEGLLLQPGSGNTLINLVFYGTRFEDNWGATATEYQVVLDGSAGGGCTVRAEFHGNQWTTSGSLSMKVTGAGAVGWNIIHPHPPNNTGEIVIDSSAGGGRVWLSSDIAALTVTDTGFKAAAPITGNYDGASPSIIRVTGIPFRATQSASTDANTLDDYEEGTWTPVLTFGTPGDLSVAYSTQLGEYNKVGRLVTVTFAIQTSTFTHSTASGNCTISGLPFAAANFNSARYGSLVWQGITKANYTDIATGVSAAGSTLTLGASGSAQSLAAVATGDMPTGGTVILRSTIIYSA